MTNPRCRIGRIKLKGGADLIILPTIARPYRTTIETVTGKVLIESENETPLTLERALFQLVDAGIMLFTANATDDEPPPPDSAA